jgi:hypothetical protein
VESSFVIYLGRNIPNSDQTVSDIDFKKFLASQNIFDSFTIYNGNGYWKGEYESVFIVEILKTTLDKAENFAQLYAEKFNQEDVLIKEILVNAKLLRGEING